MRVTCLQIDWHGVASTEDRRSQAVELLLAAAPAALYVLPELWPIGYFEFDRYKVEAEPLHGPTVAAMAEVAVRRDADIHVGSFVEDDGHGRLFNTSVVLSPDGAIAALYRKIHVFGYDSREIELISPGTELVIAPVGELRIGLATGYDLRFPELFRRLVDGGAPAVVIPACWPMARVKHWELLLAARAVENLAATVGCNGTGSSGDVPVGGATQIVSPWGEVLAHAGTTQGAATAAVDVEAIEAARVSFPALADRVLDRDREARH